MIAISGHEGENGFFSVEAFDILEESFHGTSSRYVVSSQFLQIPRQQLE
jgi:hypothetical protein